MAELSQESFLERFPEFETAGLPLIGAKLSEAHRLFDPEVFGDLYLDAVGYKAAELLAFSPYGKNARLTEQGVETTYTLALQDICSRVPARFLTVF